MRIARGGNHTSRLWWACCHVCTVARADRVSGTMFSSLAVHQEPHWKTGRIRLEKSLVRPQAALYAACGPSSLADLTPLVRLGALYARFRFVGELVQWETSNAVQRPNVVNEALPMRVYAGEIRILVGKLIYDAIVDAACCLHDIVR